MKKKTIWLILVTLLITLIFYLIYHYFHLYNYLNFASIKANEERLQVAYSKHTLAFLVGFTLIFTLSCLTIIPLFYVALNIVAGYIFGIYEGYLITSLVNVYCSILTFVLVRRFFRKAAEHHFAPTLKKINANMQHNGVLYVALMRAFPAMPVVVSNIVMSLTRINLWVYVIISQIAISPELLLTLYAGHKIKEIDDIHDIMNLKTYIWILSLVFLAIGIYWLINHYVIVRSRRKNNMAK